MKNVFSEEARNDLDDAYAYIFADKPRAAGRIERRVLDCVRLLSEQPFSEPPGRVPGTREFTVTRTPYKLIYEVDAERVTILRVMHGARLWPPRA